MTEWRPIPEWPEYEVSNDGQVRRVAPGQGAIVGRILKPSGRRYVTINLSREGGFKAFNVHRLVLLAFIGPPPTAQHECAHEDGNKRNNKQCNLSWKTPTENRADTARHGTQPRGEENAASRLTALQVMEIRRRWTPGLMSQIAREYGCAVSTIRRIVRGMSWSHV